MVHTLPDYSTKYRLASLFGNIDTAELAARLDSIVTHDRRGYVLFMDDFEGSVLRWEALTQGVGAAVALDTTNQLSGIQSVKCTTGNLTGDYSGIRRKIVYPVLSKLGFEVSFTATTGIDYYKLVTYVYIGTIRYQGQIRLDVTADNMQILNSLGGTTIFNSSLPLTVEDNLFMKIKLVIDPVTGYYTRFILNNVTYDLSSYPLYSAASSTNPYYYYSFQSYNSGDASRTFYIDDCIMTIDEPS